MTDAEIRAFCGHAVKVTRAPGGAELSGRLEPDLEKPDMFHLWLGQGAGDEAPDPLAPHEDLAVADFERIEPLP